MNFKLLQAHKSLPAGLEWNNIPDFTIITGKNGTGKSHLLETMKSLKNWEGQPFSEKDIKYIPPMHNFIDSTSINRTTYMQQSSTIYSQVLKILTSIQKPDIKETIKSFDIDLLKVATLDENDFITRYYTHIGQSKGNEIRNEMHRITKELRVRVSLFSNILQKTTHSRIEDITEKDFLDNLPPDIGNDFMNTSHLKRWFTLYFENFKTRCTSAVSNHCELTFNELHDEKKPWTLMNGILKDYSFKYQIEDFDPNIDPIEIKFTDGNANVEIKDLSSGEQQIISLVAWAHHEIISQNIKLLLLDEPDAHLHPSFCRIFIDIMNEYVVKKHKIKVIMTTHSPSTIAYAPNESIFVMDSVEPRIQKQDKDTSLNILSDGLMTLQEGGQILNKINKDAKCVVFVEGTSDVTHFELVCEKLNKENLGLQFISGYGLERLVPFLKGCPYNLLFDKTVIGIFDNDKKGEESFNSFCKEWELYRAQDSIKKKKGSDAYIMKLPLLDEHSLFCENTIELYYSKEILESQNMIDKRTLKEVNTRDDGHQMNDDDYSKKDELKYYKLCSTIKDKEKNDFANYCKALDKQEFENFKKIFSLIETIINS